MSLDDACDVPSSAGKLLVHARIRDDIGEVNTNIAHHVEYCMCVEMCIAGARRDHLFRSSLYKRLSL